MTEDDIATVILPLPTATSARAAAAALGELIEEEGSAEGFGILFLDKDGNAWVGAALELLCWAFVRCPCGALMRVGVVAWQCRWVGAGVHAQAAARPARAGQCLTALLRCPQYLENAAGHHWLAQRIPDDKFFVSANQGRFQVRP